MSVWAAEQSLHVLNRWYFMIRLFIKSWSKLKQTVESETESTSTQETSVSSGPRAAEWTKVRHCNQIIVPSRFITEVRTEASLYIYEQTWSRRHHISLKLRKSMCQEQKLQIRGEKTLSTTVQRWRHNHQHDFFSQEKGTTAEFFSWNYFTRDRKLPRCQVM